MPGSILLSTAYLPPVEYFSLIENADHVQVETHENYIKQTYRNRCYILSPSGPLMLSVPVYEGSRRKVPIAEVRIDYSKRWQQVHLRAIRAAYSNSPYFAFYFEEFERIIGHKHDFLFDLNSDLLKSILLMLRIKKEISTTMSFISIENDVHDQRYTLLTEKRELHRNKRYLQVFGDGSFECNLSIIDLIFNQGPQAKEYL